MCKLYEHSHPCCSTKNHRLKLWVQNMSRIRRLFVEMRQENTHGSSSSLRTYFAVTDPQIAHLSLLFKMDWVCSFALQAALHVCLLIWRNESIHMPLTDSLARDLSHQSMARLSPSHARIHIASRIASYCTISRRLLVNM